MMQLLLILLISISIHNATIYPIIQNKKPPIRIHYLGHSSFILFFDNGKSLLTDYGVSNSYGLNSPIYDLNDFAPDIVIYSHHDQDHDRGQKFPGAIVLDGINFSGSGIEINPFKATERKPDDNYGYEISYKGLKIIFMGDCQGSLKAGDYKALKGKIKCTPDLLLIPVGWTRDIAGGAAELTQVLNPVTVIPIHFWTAEEREKFLDCLGNKFAVVKAERIEKAEWDLMPHDKVKKAVVLTPGAYKREN